MGMVNIVGGVMGNGDKHLPNVLRRRQHHGGVGCTRDTHHDQQQRPHVPKGCLAVMVGQDGEEKQRFVVPTAYLTHPRFVHLLGEAEEEYGFERQGAIAIPCLVAEFRAIQCLIHRELFPCADRHGGCGTGDHRHRNHHARHGILGCFRG